MFGCSCCQVRYVIDTGFVKARGYHPKLGADSLQVIWGDLGLDLA